MKLSLRKTAFAALLIMPLALTACVPAGSSDSAAPDATTAPETTASQPDLTQSETPPASAEETTSPAAEATSPAVDETGSRPIANPTSELLIQITQRAQELEGYTQVSPACQATVIRLLVVAGGIMAPMAEEIKPGTVQQVKDSIAEVQGTTPKEFDAAFAKLEASVDLDMANIDPTAIERDGAAIGSYLETSCAGLQSVPV